MSSPKTPGFALQGLHVAGIGCIACAQPLLDLLGRYPEFFSARGSTPLQILVFTAIVTLLPLLVFVPISAILAPRLRFGLFLCALGALWWLSILAPVRVIGVTGVWPVFGIATAVAVSVVAVYYYRRLLLPFSVFSAVSVVAVPFSFLFMTPVEGLVWPRPVEPVSLREEVAQPFPIVLLVFDELAVDSLFNSDRLIDEQRLPGFARLAAVSTRYSNAATVSVNTLASVPAILTGMRPRKQQLPTANTHPQNLFTLLAQDYETEIFETVTQLCPPSICSTDQNFDQLLQRSWSLARDASVLYLHATLPQTLANRLPAIDSTWLNFTGRSRMGLGRTEIKRWMDDHLANQENPASEFREFVGSLRKGSGRLYFHHSLLPHVPWRYLPSGRTYGPSTFSMAPHGIAKERWFRDPMHGDLALQRYLLQLGFADRLLGELLDALEERDLLDDSLVIVTSDHGLSFLAGGSRREASRRNFADVLFVPLFVKLPGARHGRVDGRRALTVDILPTILDLLNVSAPAGMDGASLLGPGVERDVLEIHRSSGAQRYTLPWPKRHRFELLTRMKRLFGNPIKPEVLTGWTESKTWIGTEIDSLELAEPIDLEIQLDEPSLIGSIGRDSDPLPIHVTGSIANVSSRKALKLAIALGGQVRATARTYEYRGSLRFSVFVPESSWSPGGQQVEFFLIEEKACSRAERSCLRPITGSERLLSSSALSVPPGSMIFKDGFETGSIELWNGRSVDAQGVVELQEEVSPDSKPSEKISPSGS